MALHFGQNSWKLINLLILCRRQHPILHPQDQVRGIRHLRVVSHHDDAAALLMGQAAEDLHDDLRILSVQVPRWLVRQEDRRPRAQAPGNGHPLLLSARQRTVPRLILFVLLITLSAFHY